MSCPRCGKGWQEFVDNRLVCSSCGCIEEVSIKKPTYEELEHQLKECQERLAQFEGIITNIP